MQNARRQRSQTNAANLSGWRGHRVGAGPEVEETSLMPPPTGREQSISSGLVSFAIARAHRACSPFLARASRLMTQRAKANIAVIIASLDHLFGGNSF